ncbi:MAG: hypothetical protein M0P69_13665 [Bacteroidales bacterium]|nr:hypothetical protein [Bacteroidales bacterium]
MQKGLQAVALSPACNKISALDEAAEAVRYEVGRYELGLSLLIGKLEADRPKCAETCEATPAPPTMGHALSEIRCRLGEANELLESTLKRIEEQVGELKILP